MKQRLKKFLSYIICLGTPTSIVDAINEAASVDELDESVIEKAGLSR